MCLTMAYTHTQYYTELDMGYWNFVDEPITCCGMGIIAVLCVKYSYTATVYMDG